MKDEDFNQLWHNICVEFEMCIEGIYQDAAREAVKRAIEAERDACVKVCEYLVEKDEYAYADECADAIRARSNV